MSNSKLANFIKYSIYTTGLMPLIVFSEFLSPFHFGKVIVFRAAIEILGLGYVLLILRDRTYLPKPNLIFWVVTAFTLIFGLTTLTSVDAYQSFWGTLERMGGWFTFLHFWMFLVMAMGVLKKQEDWITFLKISVVVSFLSTIYGLLQKTNFEAVLGSGGRARIFGTIGNPALFAGYELWNIFFALFLIFWHKVGKNERIFYTIIFALNLIAVFSTAVRGSLLAAVVALAIFSFLFTYVGGAKKVRRLMVGGLALLVLLEVFLIFNHNADFVQNSPYLSRLSDVSTDTRTVNTRFWAWQAGLDGWNDSFRSILLGWGPENFNLPFSKHFNPKFYLGPGSETLFDRGHNMFVEILVTMGLLGFAAYLSVFGALFWGLRQIFKQTTSREIKIGTAALASGTVAYLIHNFFIFDTSANFLVFFIALGLGYYLVQSLTIPETAASKIKKEEKRRMPAPVMTGLMAILMLLVVYSIYQTAIEPVRANYTTTRAIVASWKGDHLGAINKFQEAMHYQTLGEYDIRHRYAQYLMENITAVTKKVSQEKLFGLEPRKELLLSAIEEVVKNIRSSDKDYLPHLYISRAYIILGKDDPESEFNDLALEHSLQALDIAPEFIRTYFEIAQAYLNKKDYSKAAEYFQRAAELNPEVGLSYWYWAATEFEMGHTDEGWELIKKAESARYSASEVDYSRLLGIYVKKNDFKKIAEIYEHVIDRGSKDPQDYASLAVAYQKIGNMDGAEKMARWAAELDPSFTAEAKRFVESLGRKY